MFQHVAFDGPVSKRFDYLETLVEAPATKPELVDRLDASRSTVDRAIDALEATDLVHRPGDRYEPTVLGVHAYRQRRTYLQRLSDLERAADPLLELSPGDPFDPVVLEGADVYTPEPHAPEQVFESDLQHISRATSIYGASPVVLPRFVDILEHYAMERSVDFELLFTPEVLDSLRANYAERLAAIEHDGLLDAFRYDDTVPYTFWVAETPETEYFALVTYADAGIGGLVVNDAAAAVDWGRDQLDRYFDQADPVTVLE